MTPGLAPNPLRQRLQIGLTLAGTSGIVLLFLPFTFNTIPLTDVFIKFGRFSDAFWLLSVPCILLPLPVSLGYAWWLVTGRLARWVMIASYVLAGALAFSFLYGWTVDGDYSAELILFMLLSGTSFACSAWLGLRRISADAAVGGLVVMQSVYVIAMTFWITFAVTNQDFQIGAALGVTTLIAYLGQIALLVARLRWLLVLAIPMSVMVLMMTLID